MNNSEQEPKDTDEKPAEKTVELLTSYGATLERDARSVEDVYKVQFHFEKATTTIRIALKDRQSGADVVITNMTTLPDNQTRKGFGGKAIQSILSWAKENNLKDIRAVQVQEGSEKFWTDNGFVKCKESNPCNDFIYQEPTE